MGPLYSPRMTLAAFAVDDLRMIYRVLHAHLMEHVELVDSQFFEELQHHLQGLARADGVELANHWEWEKWLAGTWRTIS